MLRLSLVAVALASFTFANAQNFTVDPNAIDAGMRCKHRLAFERPVSSQLTSSAVL
jgi:hypothetical protein